LFTLEKLEAIIAERSAADDGSSYTASLVALGAPHSARKLGEEAVETIVAAISGSRADLTAEAADLVYHLLVLLKIRDVPLSAVMSELQSRTAMSGLAEKAGRS
jgi:phosphoribosyl-ATP pyrophosphohydrolase